MSDTKMTPERITEIKDLLKYESSIAFYSHRAKESMLLLVDEAEEAARLRERVAELETEKEQPLYRASLGGRLLGLYRQQEDALSHCEEAVQRGLYRSCPVSWRKSPDGMCELFAWTSRDVEGSTGFTVTQVEARPEFDDGWGEDADEPVPGVATATESRTGGAS